ncbi:MAG: aminodeoxychorismate synthase component I [Pseudonocardiales bacterium]|nr:aminodeoxychorismate synthase component I [Pseudonocardiales bacterium]
MRTLLIDNYDSYTYNLYQLLAEVYGTAPVVVCNDDPRWHELDLRDFDGAVISPGPGRPASRRDFGHSRDILRQTELPVLGVCLGHQGLGLAAGAEVRSAPQPRHGHLSTVHHTGDGIFAGLPQRFTAVRYHSLCVADPLPPELEATAWAEDGVIMGLRHRDLPWWGVQFHPESICTEHGAQLVANFGDLALASRHRRPPRREKSVHQLVSPSRPTASMGRVEPCQSERPAMRVLVRRIDRAVDTEAAFITLYGMSTKAFWLDSAYIEAGLSRFSFLGNADGPDGEVLTFRIGDNSVIVEPTASIPYLEPGTIFDALGRRTGRQVTGAEDLPFDLNGGYVGYFGYELKADIGSPNVHRAPTPDAMWIRASRFVAVDHAEHGTYVVAVVEPDTTDSAMAWINCTVRTLRELPAVTLEQRPIVANNARISAWLARSRSRYLADIAECQRRLRAGESYEICLTNKLRLPAPEDDLEYYRRLRRLNPAPYSALLRLGELTIFSSSPERFLHINNERTVESKPIKGTTPRSTDPTLDEQLRSSLQDDDKTRAENLMIVDLLRNDLGRVCEIGTVVVPRFMATESYATVHQLVSTIRGVLSSDVTAVDCVRACFPGGSMTGAPKLRTMEIIDSLETEARGVYAGTLGYFGFGGTADLSIVIRTAVRWRDELTVGAGGAIVLGSDTHAEYDEMLLKAEAPLRALPLTTCVDLIAGTDSKPVDGRT